jgi:hypothetical protein
MAGGNVGGKALILFPTVAAVMFAGGRVGEFVTAEWSPTNRLC